MMMNEKDYELAAAWLDGQAVELTAGQRALAEEIRRDQADLLGALDVAAPAAAMDRARRRLAAATARPRIRLLAFVAGATAVAAAVLLITVVLRTQPQTASRNHSVAKARVAVPGPAYIAAVQKYAADDEIDKIALDVDDLEANIASLSATPTRNGRVGVMIDVLETDLTDFRFDDVLPDQSEI
jgi:outer membrane receptor protein involved in Fe transport